MFSVDIFAGPAYYHLIHEGASPNLSYNGWNIRFGEVIGVAF